MKRSPLLKALASAMITIPFLAAPVLAQEFPSQIEPVTMIPYLHGRVVVPPSPLKYQTLFVGGMDTVQTTATKNAPAGKALAKQWHDYIGYAPAEDGSLGYVVVNHEAVEMNDQVGDGGGMTMFKIDRKADGTIDILNQTLPDGRAGKFFNVDFVNTVGETGMNCGGISSHGRIWTAEEWYQTRNTGIYSAGAGIRDTADFTIGALQPTGFTGLDGKVIKKYQNLNWMVEINPKEAKAIRKQYNWGRQGFECGVVMPDNTTIYLFEDGANGKSLFTKFVATTPGDFTTGNLYFYKQDAGSFTGTWIQVPNNPATDWDILVAPHEWAKKQGITGFTRLEWGQINKNDGKIYITETGADKPGAAYKTAMADGWTIPKHTRDRAAAQGVAVDSTGYWDYYGRVLVFDPTDNSVKSYIEGGPYVETKDATPKNYPSKHLSNPDGIGFLYVNDKTYMVIEEDLNGVSMGRMPNTGITTTNCEAWLLDMSKEPTIDNLYRLAISPLGSEITGFAAFDEGDVVLINSQHPNNAVCEAPFNNSLTFAVTGLKAFSTGIVAEAENNGSGLRVFPNPTSTELNFNLTTDAALYDVNGARVKVVRDSQSMDISNLSAGTYYLMTPDRKTQSIVITR